MKCSCLLLFSLLHCWCACAWDYQGHRMVNELALASLPTNFPGFVFTAAAKERIAFLSGEADRWRNSPDLTARHATAPDHYFDVDDLPLFDLTPKTVSPFRYEFAAQLALARAKYPERFRHLLTMTNNADHTRELVGFLPWTINEQFAKLESAFGYLKAFEDAGTAEEIDNARQNVIYLMGVMGHFVGDAAQPLHTTKHFNGWIGANPKRYATNRTFHSWIDGGFIRRSGINAGELRGNIRSARFLWPNAGGAHTDAFEESMKFVLAQFEYVEHLYELDRDGKLSPQNESAKEGRAFIAQQLVKGGQFLGDLWFSAWRQAPADKYLANELARRRQTNELSTPKP